jgi:hypothetical protein
MVQAARSGGKNIAEGSRAAATTSQTELRLEEIGQVLGFTERTASGIGPSLGRGIRGNEPKNR